MANKLIEKGLVLDLNLHRYMKYNSANKIKQFFNNYKYGHILVYYQKITNCRASLGLNRTTEYSQNRVQKYFLYNSAYTLLDK